MKVGINAYMSLYIESLPTLLLLLRTYVEDIVRSFGYERGTWGIDNIPVGTTQTGLCFSSL